MKLTVKNYRCVKTADIDLERITMIAGTNHSGKTSLLNALSTCLTGGEIQHLGLTKNEAYKLIRYGTQDAESSLSIGLNSVKIQYPSLTVTAKGTLPKANPQALGLKRPTSMSSKELSEYYNKLLQSEPTIEEIQSALTELNVSKDSIASTIETVKRYGIDATYSRSKESGTRAKGAWEQITGESFGTKKMESWRPKTWEIDLDTVSEETLKNAISDEKNFLEAAIIGNAVSKAKVDELTQSASKIETLTSEYKNLQDSLEKLKLEAKLLINDSECVSGLKCPKCKTDLVGIIDGGDWFLIPGDTVTKTNNDEKLKQINSKIADLQTKITQTRIEKSKAESAIEELKKIPKDVQESDVTKVDECRLSLRRAEDRYNAFVQKLKADEQSNLISDLLKIVKCLAPDGLKLETLKKKIDKYNRDMKEISDLAQWRPIKLTYDLSVLMGETPYKLLSESEQFRCDTVIQIADSIISGCEIVVIDRADILDRGGRNGLIMMLYKIKKLISVIGMTLDYQEQLPNMKAVGGTGYFIQNGEIVNGPTD